MSFRTSALAAVLAMGLSTCAIAKELEMYGSATVPATGDAQSIRSIATKAAKRQAVVAGLNRVIGPEASNDPKVADKVQAIVDQISDSRIVDSKGSKIGSDYEMKVTLIMDDKEFRSLISDAGIASNTATTRSFAILAVMDEFLTTPKDLKAPLSELTEFHSEKGQSFKDKSINAKASANASASSSSSASSVDARSSSAVDARAASSAKSKGSYNSNLAASDQAAVAGSARDSDGSASFGASGEGRVSASESAKFSGERSSSGSYKGSTSGSLKASEAQSASAVASQRSSAVSAKNVASEEHDNVSYRKLVNYQPQNTSPEKTSQTYNALMGQLQDYDLRVVDNDMFRSKYFKSKPITIEQMQNSEELSKYVSFAKKDANADFFMVGTSIIIDEGKNASTGESVCTGVATVKTYSTVNAESIASETISESAAGRSVNDCAGNLAKKLALVGGPLIGAKVQEYWKKRSTYGREFILTLTGTALPLMVKTSFTKALKSVPGVEGNVQRASTDKEMQIVVTYKGTDPLDQAVSEALSSNPIFASLDSKTEGNQILLCLGPCSKPETEKPQRAKKK
jgi:hypothetical protein